MSAPSQKRDVWQPDMSQVDELAVDFACNGTRMLLNKDERIVAVRRMMGTRRARDIAVLIGTFDAEIGRIARSTAGTMPCPFCLQYTYVDDGVVRRHVDMHGLPWCPQSGKHKDTRCMSVEDLKRGRSRR